MAEGYSILWAQFWTGQTGRKIVKQGSEATVLALYLMTSPMKNMIGLYYLPVETIVQHTPLPKKKVNENLLFLQKIDFSSYDFTQECVWVKEMARFQLGLGPLDNIPFNDSRVKRINKLLQSQVSSPWFSPFAFRYRTQLCLDPDMLRVLLKTKEEQRGVDAPPTGGHTVHIISEAESLCQIRQAESWPPEHKPILDYLLSQQYLPSPLEAFGLRDFDWWKLTGKTCGGISVELLERELPRLALWMKNNRKVWTEKGARGRISRWLQNSVEWKQR